MMKKYAYALAGLLLAGCTGDFVKLGAGEQWGEFTATFTLQGKIMDARTGAPIGGDDLKLKLIQGTEIREPTRLNKDSTDVLMGEYAFANIPLTSQYNADYKIVAIKDGYIRFEAIIDMGAYYDTNFPLMDTVYNYIGNIYLQPLGSSAPEIVVNVDFNGRPIQGATVMMDPSSTTWNNGTDQTYILSPSWGYVGAIPVATTDATGKAKFPGGSLGLGVVYTVRVNPITFEGVGLVQPTTTGQTVAVGVVGSTNELSISMADAAPGNNAYGLFVVDSSNRGGALAASGVLTVTFNRPVMLTGDLNTKFSALINYGTLQPFPAPAVLATLSPDGLTMTLTPNWATQPNPSTDRGAYVDYYGSVSVAGYPGSSLDVFTLAQSYGGTLNRRVWVTNTN